MSCSSSLGRRFEDENYDTDNNSELDEQGEDWKDKRFTRKHWVSLTLRGEDTSWTSADNSRRKREETKILSQDLVC